MTPGRERFFLQFFEVLSDRQLFSCCDQIFLIKNGFGKKSSTPYTSGPQDDLESAAGHEQKRNGRGDSVRAPFLEELTLHRQAGIL